MNRIDELQDVIRDLHGTEATHEKTVPVKETFQGQTIWEGDVEIFTLENHPEAKRVYVWSHGDPPQHINSSTDTASHNATESCTSGDCWHV